MNKPKTLCKCAGCEQQLEQWQIRAFDALLRWHHNRHTDTYEVNVFYGMNLSGGIVLLAWLKFDPFGQGLAETKSCQ